MKAPGIAVLGVTGMLGHKMFQELRHHFENVWGVSRDPLTSTRFERVSIFRGSEIVRGIDAGNWTELNDVLVRRRPDYVINCIGVVKQRPEAESPIPSLLINALLPHRLAEAAAEWGGRVIHFSTDCVFRGTGGGYREEDPPDARDLYGRSKALGEVTGPNALTLRTSMIGRELAGFRSLLEWFLSQRGRTVHGYQRAIYSGVTTNHLAKIVAKLIRSEHRLAGLYQIAADPITKYDLLRLIRATYGLDIEIVAVPGEACDRSMRGERFISATGHRCPRWPELIEELHRDPTPYEEWRTEQHEAIVQAP